MRRYELGAFELSQAYLFFWDKLERSNWFLEQVIATAAEDIDSRLVQHMLTTPVDDGGQWDMVVNLVRKYGVVPQVLYPDSWNASTSAVLNDLVVTKLREFALVLRDMVGHGGASAAAAALSDAKAKMLRQIHTILTLTLGPPPAPDAEFAWTYADKNARVHTVRATPRCFAQGISGGGAVSPLAGRATATLFSTLEDMVSLVHDPRHPALMRLAIDRLGNVVGKREVSYVNVDMATMKAACVAMLRAGRPVFFGCDSRMSRNDGNGEHGGIFDLDAIDYRLGFGPDAGDMMGMDKAQRLSTHHSLMAHAMVLTGVHLEQPEAGGKERPVRWRVQNSWGSDMGEKGWYVMTDRWMDEWVYQAVVDPRFLSREVRDVVKAKPVVLPLWDPLGTLALA